MKHLLESHPWNEEKKEETHLKYIYCELPKKRGKKHREKEKFSCWWERTEIHNLSNHIQTHTDTGRALMVDFNCIYYKSKEKLLYRTNTKM